METDQLASESEFIRTIEWDMMDKAKFFPLSMLSSFSIRCCFYPLTLIKTQLQVQFKNNVYSGMFDAVYKIYRAEGAAGLYRGFWISSVQIFSGVFYIRLTDENRMTILASQYQLADAKPQNTKKRSTREIDAIIALSETDPRRMEGIRKFSAIYGRFDCKRRPEKPLTLHEVCVNEAAAQMCRFIPALLTRRVELFPLARQVVKDAGFGHSAGIARIAMCQQSSSSRSTEDDSQAKRMRLPSDTSSEYSKDYHTSAEEMRHNLLQIYHKLGKSFDVGDIAARFSSTRYSRSDCEEDLRFSFSSSSSPQLQSSNGGDNDVEDENKMIGEMDRSADDEKEVTVTANINANGNGSLGVRVLSASGNNIIAVANPALALSLTLVEPVNIKRETADD